MKTRFLAIIMAVVFLFPCYQGVNAASVQPYASQYLSNYIAVLTAGNSSGKINIAFSVGGTTGTTTVGVQKAMIYKSNGSYVTTVYFDNFSDLLRFFLISLSIHFFKFGNLFCREWLYRNVLRFLPQFDSTRIKLSANMLQYSHR